MRRETLGKIGIAAALLLGSCFLTASSCEDGKDGLPGAAGTPGTPPPINTNLGPYDDLPGVVITITQISGASGLDGTFQVGDFISVTFTVTTKSGGTLPLDELNYGGLYVSGPSFNYQRVLARERDLITRSVMNPDGSYTYTFALPIPATYLPPLNDTATFTEGELQGQALLAGTYTAGIESYKNYSVEGESTRDPGNATRDFLFGGSLVLQPREVVKRANCNRCHDDLRLHGGFRRDVKLCLLCHTAGSEDKNVLAVEGGTPDITVEFSVMIHKIHNAAHLPSVLGVTTTGGGTRDYTATPKPYKIVGFGDNVHDYSHVAFPAWPNLGYPMPRDQGYTGLTSTEKGLENSIRSGATDCAKCHGDPDGTGPLTAPAQGDQAYTQPTRRACGACHDDIVWTNPYTANGTTMPAQLNDSACALCHTDSGNNLDSILGHLHPLLDPAVNPGMNVAVSAVTPSAGPTLDPGEKLQVQFSLKDDLGNDVDPSTDVSNLYVVVSGPNNNRQVALYTSFPVPALGGAPAASYTLNVPQPAVLEFLGDATGAAQTLTASMSPFWDSLGGTTTVYERTATGAGDTLTAAAPALQNFVDVTTGGTFTAGDHVVLADGTGMEEYLRVMGVIGNRVYFGTTYSQPSQSFLRNTHGLGTTIDIVTLTAKTVTTDYTLTEAVGDVNLVAGRFTATNAVVVTYTTDFVLPAVYPPPFNDTPDLDEVWGEWTGKPIESGTYTVGIWARRDITLSLFGENNNYRAPSLLGTGGDFLVGTATILRPYDLISSANTCTACHNQPQFHGGSRRGADTCLMCHASPGAEDGPKFRWPGAPDTTGVSIPFHRMLHKIHMGKDLSNASTYTVAGFNGNPHTYEHVGFPTMPGAAKHCATCHGTSDAWKEPVSRDHSTAQTVPSRPWRSVCGSCHDSAAAGAHIDLQTSPSGVESCAVCHGQGKQYNVELKHKNR